MAAPYRADTPNDLHKQAEPDGARLKIKLKAQHRWGWVGMSWVALRRKLHAPGVVGRSVGADPLGTGQNASRSTPVTGPKSCDDSADIARLRPENAGRRRAMRSPVQPITVTDHEVRAQPHIPRR